ncbi:hypothetical protein [Chryseobacterium taklimakanense]|uniref:Uncharacterized protein n=1 Tax=Chryseobacterium taklimakanense TaxID=536441 RepID=A0A3G8WG50_9FLAO|nr:hypothetical protein [Chryseobacterium taklimakanense]AZI20150.1 hypothetical protein EIH08_04940 [Chryseobacterium taklimakanense]
MEEVKNFYEIISQFQRTWPIDRVQKMELHEYTNLNKSDSFCYWLEARSVGAGSIWGGSAFKFGIYEKNNKSTKFNSLGRLSDDDYAWMEKYGSDRSMVIICGEKQP